MPAKEQDVTISIKAKLYPDQNTIEEFKKLTTAYSEAATWLSDLMFNDFSSPEMITDCRTLHDKYYYDIRQKHVVDPPQQRGRLSTSRTADQNDRSLQLCDGFFLFYVFLHFSLLFFVT